MNFLKKTFVQFWHIISEAGVEHDFDPSFRKRIILVNTSSMLFSLTLIALGLIFWSIGEFLPSWFCVFFSIVLLIPIILNNKKYFFQAPISLLLISNILGLILCALVGRNTNLYQGFYVLCPSAWLFFSSENRKTTIALSLLPFVGYFLIHLGYLDFLKIVNITDHLALSVQGTSSIVFMSLLVACSYYLTREHEIAENRMREYRAISVHSSKLASLGEMAGGIAHEINNPLAVISSSMKMLEKAKSKNKLNDNLLEEVIKDVEKTVQRVTKIVAGLRTVSRDSTDVKIEAIALKVIFDDVLGLCSEKFKNNGVSFQFDEQDINLTKEVLIDQVQISQVFLNLLGNSYDAIEQLPEKWIKIDLKNLNENIEIRFTDSGRGISQEIQEKIFHPFFTSKAIGKGTGLGLSISKNIVENNLGELYFDSSSPNTCFVVSLPKAVSPNVNTKKVS